jgi:DEP domain-containing protein 5
METLSEKGSRPQTSSSSMSRLGASAERKCTLWIHDEQFSKEEVVLNLDLFPAESVKPGDLMAIIALKADVAVREFFPPKKGLENISASLQPDIGAEERKSSKGSINMDTHHDIDLERRYLFAVRDFSKDLKAKHPNLEISIAKHIADVFGFKHRSNVLLTTVSFSNPAFWKWS